MAENRLNTSTINIHTIEPINFLLIQIQKKRMTKRDKKSLQKRPEKMTHPGRNKKKNEPYSKQERERERGKKKRCKEQLCAQKKENNEKRLVKEERK